MSLMAPADSGVCAVARPEQVVLRVYVQLLDNRAVDNDKDSGPSLAGRGRYQVELGREHGFRGCKHYRKIFRKTARHNGVGGGLGDRYLAPALRYLSKNLIGRASRVIEKIVHALQCGRHNRKPVRPAQLVASLYRLYRVVPFRRHKVLHIPASFSCTQYKGLGNGCQESVWGYKISPCSVL